MEAMTNVPTIPIGSPIVKPLFDVEELEAAEVIEETNGSAMEAVDFVDAVEEKDEYVAEGRENMVEGAEIVGCLPLAEVVDASLEADRLEMVEGTESRTVSLYAH